MTRTPQDDKLHAALNEFVADAMPRLREATDIAKLPVSTRLEVVEELGRQHVKESNGPNWWQINSYIYPVLGLSSLKKAVAACFEHTLIRSRQGKIAYALGSGISFSVDDIPLQFLGECVVRQNGLRFSQRTFENVFRDLENFLTPAPKNIAHLIAPLDRIRSDKRQILLGADARIRRLSLYHTVDLVNHCPTLRHFYGHGFHPWFNTVLELDCAFEWTWVDSEPKEQREILLALKQQNASLLPLRALMNRLMEEMVLLRSLLRKPVCSPTYVIDYRGWQSWFFSARVDHLPWVRSTFFDELDINQSEFKKFVKFREKFLNMRDQKIKRRIFAAMRRLSSSLERPYAGDKLFDAVAGLEGLLVNERTELRHRFAEHTALLLERQPAKRERLFREMLRAYELRGKVAHGDVVADDRLAIIGREKPSKEQLREFNEINKLSGRCAGLLQKAIIICIDREKVFFDWEKAVMTSKRLT